MNKYKNEKWLRKKYIEEKFSQEEIGRQCNISGKTINWWLKKFAIPLRTFKQVQEAYHLKLERPYKNKDWLVQQYENKHLSIRGISRLSDATDATIRKYLKIFNIRIRTAGETNSFRYQKRNLLYMNKNWLYQKYITENLSLKKIGELCSVHFGTIYNWIKRFGIIKEKENPLYTNKQWLEQKYIIEKLSTCKIAKLLNVTPEVIHKWLIKNKIEIRNYSEARIGIEPWNKGVKNCFSEETCRKHSEWMKANMSGENHPMWRGGISFEPYGIEFNDKLKKQIRRRDDFICQYCGIKENGKAHHTHHVDYNKRNNDPLNLLTLCNSHNAMANNHRKKWQMFFEIYQEIRKI